MFGCFRKLCCVSTGIEYKLPLQDARFPRGEWWASSTQSVCGVSPVPLLPQESRTFRSIQIVFYQLVQLIEFFIATAI